MNYVVDSILHYVQRANTNYAVLLNGSWGSGKTYFWENILRTEIEKIEVGEKKLKTIYVSLYGINSLEEINKRIVLDNLIKKSNLVQKVGESKWGGKLTELAKMTVGAVKSLDIPVLKEVLEAQVNYENLLDFTDTVLCFDDLERANIGITDIMGYINNFVEHDGVKVIIISNEREISDKLVNQNIELKMLVSSFILDKEGVFNKQNAVQTGVKAEETPSEKLLEDKLLQLFDRTNDYKRIKEKLIGKTFTYIPDYPSLITEMVTNVSETELKDFYLKHIDSIYTTFKNSGIENIRILKQAMEDFETIFPAYNEKYGHLGEELLSSILEFTLAVSFEIKSGAEGNGDFEHLSSNDDYISAMSLASILRSEKKTYLKSFKDKYFSNTNIYNGLIFFKFVELLVRNGIFNGDVFEKEMNSIANKRVDPTPLHVKFIRNGYWEFSDEEFFEVQGDTYRKLLNGDVHFTLYLNAFMMFRYLMEKGLFPKKLDELKTELVSGLEKAAGLATNPTESIDTYFFGTEIKPNDTNLMEFKERVISINQELRKKKEEREIQGLIEHMDSDFSAFVISMKEKFYIPVFSYFNIEELFSKIISLSNSDISSIGELFKDRYKFEEETKQYKLYLELDNLIRLKLSVDEYVEGKDVTPKLVVLKDLSKTLDEVIKRIELLITKEQENVEETQVPTFEDELDKGE